MELSGILIPEPREWADVAAAAVAAQVARPELRVVLIKTTAIDAPPYVQMAYSCAAVEHGDRDECHCVSGAVIAL